MEEQESPMSEKEKAFRRELTAVYPDVVRYCSYLMRRHPNCREEGRDLAQEAMMSAVRKWDRFDGESAVKSWVITIARNLCIDRYRDRKKKMTINNQFDEARYELHEHTWMPDYVGNWEREAMSQNLRKALGLLPSMPRTVLTMRLLNEMPYSTIADKMGIPEGTVKSNINRFAPILSRKVAEMTRPPLPTA